MTTETTAASVTETDCGNPIALSVAGGAVGTITGLKRGGIPGAITGGLVGGTVGYVSGVVSRDGMVVVEDPPTDGDPISIDPAESTSADSATDGTETADADNNAVEDSDEQDSTTKTDDDTDREPDA